MLIMLIKLLRLIMMIMMIILIMLIMSKISVITFINSQAAYASYLPFPLPLPSQINPDHRLSSINTLRLKAKEQMEIFKESCFNR